MSVVVPHRNASHYLGGLLASIPDDPRFELLVVDDGSCDDERQRAQELIAGRQYARFLEGDGGGAGSARNRGLDEARGDWIMFADSDDLFASEFFPALNRLLANAADADIIFLKCDSFNDASGESSDRHSAVNRLLALGLEGNETPSRTRWYPPWGKIYRRSLIEMHTIRFDRTVASNDVMFSLRAGHLASEVAYIDSVAYLIRKSANSLTARTDLHRAIARVEVAIAYNRYIRVHGIGTRPVFPRSSLKRLIRNSAKRGVMSLLFAFARSAALAGFGLLIQRRAPSLAVGPSGPSTKGSAAE